MTIRRQWRAGRALVTLALTTMAAGVATIGAGGCAVLGVAANAMPRPPVKPKVVLAGQSVGIMVWADRALRISWPTARTDLGGAVEARLKQAQQANAEELADTTFPYPAASFVRWQQDRPGFEAEPIAQIAPRLQVRRLIYIELDTLDTRSANAVTLYRGSATAAVKVFGVDEPGSQSTGKLLYEERIRVVFPKTSTEDGRPEGSDQAMYNGTLSALADEIAKRFIEHPAEDDQ